MERTFNEYIRVSGRGERISMKANETLAQTAKEEALKCYHGFVMQTHSNIGTIIEPFPKWSLEEADGNWCAAFVYHCL